MLSRHEIWQSLPDSTTAAASIDCPFRYTHATSLPMLSGKAVYTPNRHRLAEGQCLGGSARFESGCTVSRSSPRRSPYSIVTTVAKGSCWLSILMTGVGISSGKLFRTASCSSLRGAATPCSALHALITLVHGCVPPLDPDQQEVPPTHLEELRITDKTAKAPPSVRM